MALTDHESLLSLAHAVSVKGEFTFVVTVMVLDTYP